MNKREKIEQAKLLLEYQTLYAALPRKVRDHQLKSIRRNSPAAGGEYRYLRITIEDVDAGKAIGPAVFTYRKPEDVDALREKITSIAKWPDELLAGIVTSEVVFSGGERLSGQMTGAKLQNNQMLGGRKKQSSVSPQTARKYLALARTYDKSNLSQREFANEYCTSVKTLQRALSYRKGVKQR